MSRITVIGRLGSTIGLAAVAAILWSAQSYAQAIDGVFTVVKGNVKVIQASDGQTVQAKLGAKVYPKDTIVAAGNDSRAKIVMVDNNELNISPNSRFTIKTYEYQPQANKKNVLLQIMYGKVRAKVKQKYLGKNKFEVQTPSAVAGVRGTDFITSYSRPTNTSSVVTFSGRVAFGLPGFGGAINHAVSVSAGQMSQLFGKRPPAPPVAMSPHFMTMMDHQSDADKATGPTSSPRTPAESPQHNDENKNQPDAQPSGAGAAGSGAMNAAPSPGDSSAGPASGQPDSTGATASPTGANSSPQQGTPGSAPEVGSNPPPANGSTANREPASLGPAPGPNMMLPTDIGAGGLESPNAVMPPMPQVLPTPPPMPPLPPKLPPQLQFGTARVNISVTTGP